MDLWQFCTTLWHALNAVAAELALLLLGLLVYQLRQMRKRVDEQLLAVSKVVTSAADYLDDQLHELRERRIQLRERKRAEPDRDEPPSEPDVKRRIWTAWKGNDAS